MGYTVRAIFLMLLTSLASFSRLALADESDGELKKAVIEAEDKHWPCPLSNKGCVDRGEEKALAEIHLNKKSGDFARADIISEDGGDEDIAWLKKVNGKWTVLGFDDEVDLRELPKDIIN